MSKQRGGLGKGLKALFDETNVKVKTAFETVNNESMVLDVENIVPNKNQPRYLFDEESLNLLSKSIKQNGLIQPIIVRKLENDMFEIVAGERRFKALQLAGIKRVPVVVKHIDQKKSTELALIENLQRENLNPVEEAKGFLNLVQNYGLTQEEVANKVGKSRSAVANSMRLLNLPDEILKEVEKFNLSEGQARTLLSVSDLNLMKNMAKKAIELKLSVRELEKLCAATKKSNKTNVGKKLKETENILYKELERTIKLELKRNVKIEVVSGEKGRLVIDFYNRDDLISMTNLLAGLK